MRRRGKLGAWAVLAALLALPLGLYVQARWYGDTPLQVFGAGVEYVVAPRTGLWALATDLETRGIVTHPLAFVVLAYSEGKARRIQAGEYRVAPGSTPRQLLDDIVAGRVIQHPLTLVEGWTFRQVRAALDAHPKLAHTLQGVSDTEVMTRLGWPGQHPEGRFFPDTYRFPAGFSDAAFLQRAHHAMAQQLAAAWSGRAVDVPYQTPDEALIMASIVERETAQADERPQVAGVFVRRLRIGMPLATDPTVIYGLGAGYDGNIHKQDLRADTPYNTYLHAGLPPTPIAMPGKGALEAALHPAPGAALYFVAKGNGYHYFSATYTEHQQAVMRYQVLPAQQR